VHDRSGTAVAEAKVLLAETGGEATTDADGRFRLRPVPRGKHTLIVRVKGRRDVRRRITVPASTYPSYEVEV